MIELIDVTKTYNAGRPNAFTAVRQFSGRLPAGAIVVVKGPSGSGKTTLLSLIGCMVRPTSGRIFFRDREITSLTERFLSAIRRTTFGFVFQHYQLIRGIGVLENVMLPAYPLGEPHGRLRRRAEELLSRLGIGSKAPLKIEQLSGGEQQRVAIARALINDPEVVVADEPTAHLDTDLAGAFLQIVRDLKAEGRSVLIASHDPLVCRDAMVDLLLELRDGRMVSAGEAPR